MPGATSGEAAPLLPGSTLSHRKREQPVSEMVSKIKEALWGPPSVERSLLIKLDFTVLIYFSVVWFLFGVNRASYNTAYISGMKEDLNFQGKVSDARQCNKNNIQKPAYQIERLT